jgi:hypothetical protein
VIVEGQLDANDVLNVDMVRVLRPELLPQAPEIAPESISGQPDDSPEMSLTDAAIQNWATTSVMSYGSRQLIDSDPDFVPPWNRLEPRYDEYADAFADTGSQAEWDALKIHIDRSLQADQVFAEADAGDHLANFGIQLLDPVLLPLMMVPGAASVKTGAAGVRQAAARGAAIGVGEAAVLETMLQATDPTRSRAESLTTMAASAVLGSIFGSAGHGIARLMGRGGVEQAHAEAAEVMRNAARANAAGSGDSTAGAQAVPALRPTLEGEKPLTNLAKWAMFIRSPSLRLLNDRVSATASWAVDRLIPHNIMKAKHLRGETANPQGSLYGQIMQERERNTSAMILQVANAKKALAKAGKKFSLEEIGTMIGRAARQNDVPDHPELQGAVDQFRKIMDDWGERAKKQGIITEEALGSVESYFPRLYDVRKIGRNYDRWRQVLGAHFSAKYPDLIQAELDDIASSVYNTLLGVPVNQLHMGSTFKAPKSVLTSGHLKARVLDLSDLELEEFLIDDVRYVTQHYLRSMAPGVLSREMFGADDIELMEGYPVIKSIINDIDQDYKNAINNNPAQAAKLSKQRVKAIEDMKYLMSSVLGYGNPAQGMTQGAQWGRVISSEARSFTAAAGLGQMALSAIPDIANLVLTHGLGNLIRSMPAILMPRKWSNSAKADFDAIGIGLDTVLSTRLLRQADLEDQSFNAFSRGMGGHQVATGSFKVFGANLWNSWMKRAAATASQNRILKDSLRYDRLSKVRRAKLASLGIDEATARTFARELKGQGVQKRQGVYYADVANWDDPQAASLFERILFRDVETTIVTPQVGEMPKVLDNGAGLMFSQFKRFVMAHQNQIMAQAGQRLAMGDVAVLNYIIALSGLAMTTEYVRTLSKNNFDVDAANDHMQSLSPADLIFTAFDRSAGLSFGTDVLSGIDGISGGFLGQELGFSEKLQYSSRGTDLPRAVSGSIPALGVAGKAVRAGTAGIQHAIGTDQFTQKDLNAARQMLPMQNTFYLAWLFDMLEEGVGGDLPSGGR